MSSAPLRDKHERTLELFERRARSIFDCELARRDDALEMGKQLQLTVKHAPAEKSSIQELSMVVPPKESVAYAMTLIRPFTLNNDRIRYSNVMSALRYFIPEDSGSIEEVIDGLNLAWEEYPFRRMQTTHSQVGPDNILSPEISAWDNHIARKFLYGDLVHGDDNAELLDALGEEQVVFAASAMVSDGFILVNNTYQVLHELRPDLAPRNAYFVQREIDRSVEPS